MRLPPQGLKVVSINPHLRRVTLATPNGPVPPSHPLQRQDDPD